MINPQLLGYIRQQLSLNVSKEAIANSLKSQGWTDADLGEAFAAVGVVTPPTPTAPVTPLSPATSAPASAISSLSSPMTPNVNPSFSQPQPVVNVSVAPHTKSKAIFFIVFVLILLGAVGAGAYVYYTGTFVKLPTLLSKSMEKARATTSSKYDVTVNVDFSEMKDVMSGLNSMPSLGANSQKLSLTVKGLSDISDPENFKNSSVISVSMGSFSLEAEFRIVHNIFYAQLTKAPALGILPIPMLSLYENKWFSFPFKSENGQTITNPFSSISGISSKVIDKITPEEKERLYKMFRDAHFVKQTGKLSPETISGESSYHFAFDLDKDGISSYLQSLKEYINSIGKSDSSLSAFDPTSIKKELDNLKAFQGEIWIGRNDKLVHKIAVSFGVQPNLTKNEQVKLNMVAIMSDYNEPVLITAPTESTSFETLVSNVMNDSIGSARQKGNEAAIKATMANIRPQAELFWDARKGVYSGFCLSTELKTSRTYIEDKGGTGFVCKEAAQKYAIGVKLSDSSGYWCIDSTGVIKSTTIPPSGTVCPVK